MRKQAPWAAAGQSGTSGCYFMLWKTPSLLISGKVLGASAPRGCLSTILHDGLGDETISRWEGFICLIEESQFSFYELRRKICIVLEAPLFSDYGNIVTAGPANLRSDQKGRHQSLDLEPPFQWCPFLVLDTFLITQSLHSPALHPIIMESMNGWVFSRECWLVGRRPPISDLKCQL